jgi:hypothetical protein
MMDLAAFSAIIRTRAPLYATKNQMASENIARYVFAWFYYGADKIPHRDPLFPREVFVVHG